MSFDGTRFVASILYIKFQATVHVTLFKYNLKQIKIYCGNIFSHTRLHGDGYRGFSDPRWWNARVRLDGDDVFKPRYDNIMAWALSPMRAGNPAPNNHNIFDY